MPIANYSTGQSVDTSVSNIMKMLVRAGATEIRLTYSGTLASGLAFQLNTEYGLQAFELPVRVAGVHAVLNADPKVQKSYRTIEHAQKVAWRTAHDWLRAQLAIVESGLVSVDEALFPYMLVSGETAFRRYTSTQRELEQ